MSAFAGLVTAVQTLPSSATVTEDSWQSLSAHVPESYGLANLVDDTAGFDTTSPKTRLIAILACLKNKQGLQRGAGDREAASRVGDYAAATIAPCSRSEPDHDADGGGDEYEETTQRSREMAVYGLEILNICNDDYSAMFSDETILTLISFMDIGSQERLQNAPHYHLAPQSYPWATLEARDLASQVLAKQLSQYFTTETLVVKTILQDYLRPLFSKARPSAITASGRKAEFRDEEDTHRGLRDEIEAKPWKYADHRAIAVFRWVVHEANETLVSQQWPLFIPVLLALLDDGSTRVRSAGLHTMKDFLTKFPDNILRDTGLANVFGDALFPTLHFLPTITPEDESIQLLSPAYKSLLMLAGKVNARAKSGPNTSHTPRARLLDRILRDGVLAAYFHAKEHVRICQLLFYINMWLVKDMGINAVKHLKDLVPMHCEVLTDPFASAAPELQHLAIKSLGVVIANCWPRMAQGPHQEEILKALVVCFLNAHDDLAANKQLEHTKDLLVRVATMLSIVADDRDSLSTRVTPLIEKEAVLADLFKTI